MFGTRDECGRPLHKIQDLSSSRRPSHSVTMNVQDHRKHVANTSVAPIFSDAGQLFQEYGMMACQNATIASQHAAMTVNSLRPTPYQIGYARRSIPGGLQEPEQIRPPAGVFFPRSSLGTGHPQPEGLLHRPNTANAPTGFQHTPDLHKLVTRPNDGIAARLDGDIFHRTSVLAASGVPFDVPTYSNAHSWQHRVMQGRP